MGKLRSLTLRLAPDELDAAFPLATAEDRRRFRILCDGYIRGRYDRHFEVGKTEFAWLAERAKRLAEASRRVCLARIRALRRLAREQEALGLPPPEGQEGDPSDEDDG